MRRTLVEQLIKQDDENTYFLTAGVGYGVLDPLKEKMGDRFINVGIAEPSMISIVAGIILGGRERGVELKVYTYTMCAFYLRAIEQIRNDLCYQDLPVTMIGVGTGFDYEKHGTTHFATEDDRIIMHLRNIEVETPRSKSELAYLLEEEVKEPKHCKRIRHPKYIRVSRFDKYKGFRYKLNRYPKNGGSLDYYKKTYGN